MPLKHLIRLSISLTAGLIAILCFPAGCAKKSSTGTRVDDIDYYTCTMHPSVHAHEPGRCPICSMELVPVKKLDRPDSAVAREDSKPHEFTVPLDRQQLIGVTFATASKQTLRREIRATGTVASTTENHWDYVSRVDGYIHNLNVAAPGDRVKQGQVLMDIYSPDLVATEQEFLDTLRMRDSARGRHDELALQSAEHLLAGARARLAQWNIADEQIQNLEKTGQAEPLLELRSPFSGVIEDIPVHQGRRVAMGDHLVDLVDLSSVWIWAEFYENEIPSVKTGMGVSIRQSADPALAIEGTVGLVDPFINPHSRTARVRIDAKNPDEKLRPGAYVDVILHIKDGVGIVIPLSAVLLTGEHSVVFVDKGGGKLEPRYVQVGPKYDNGYAIVSGVAEGERVVASANFLIDAEAKVQGALKSW